MDGLGQTSQTLIKAADSTDGRTRCASHSITPDRVASYLFVLDARVMAGGMCSPVRRTIRDPERRGAPPDGWRRQWPEPSPVLLPMKCGVPDTEMARELPNLLPILTRAIDWNLIEQQYDELIKYAAALQHRTADVESILRRFARASVQRPS